MSPRRSRDDRGAGLVEYALLVAFVSAISVSALTFMGGSTSGQLDNAGAFADSPTTTSALPNWMVTTTTAAGPTTTFTTLPPFTTTTVPVATTVTTVPVSTTVTTTVTTCTTNPGNGSCIPKPKK
jgi:Flp pilus assembly pilin Flp